MECVKIAPPPMWTWGAIVTQLIWQELLWRWSVYKPTVNVFVQRGVCCSDFWTLTNPLVTCETFRCQSRSWSCSCCHCGLPNVRWKVRVTTTRRAGWSILALIAFVRTTEQQHTDRHCHTGDMHTRPMAHTGVSNPPPHYGWENNTPHPTQQITLYFSRNYLTIHMQQIS